MIKKFHQLITEFIVMMPHTVKEIRNKSDEIAHTILIYYQVIYTNNVLNNLILFNKLHFLGRIRTSNE